MVLFVPKRAKFITSTFKGDHISEFSGEKQHLWVELLKISCKEELKIDRGLPLGFVVIGPEHLKFNHETQTTTKKIERKRTPYHRPNFGSNQKKKKNSTSRFFK